MADSFREIHFAAPDGLSLYARLYEPEIKTDNLPVACLPGLTRNSRDFHELALFLSQHPQTRRRVITFDYRGRGLSAYDPDWSHYNIGTEAGDIIAGLAHLQISRAIFLGTSRGGLITHILAAFAPQLLAGVILNDIGPEIAVEGLKQIAGYLDGARQPGNWDDAAELQLAVHGSAFPALTNADWHRFAHAIYREDNGIIRSDYDSNLLKTMEGVDYSQKLPDLWAQFDLMKDLPLLVIRGENTKLLAQETVDEMARRHNALQLFNVAGQGHAPLLETGRLPDLIAAFASGVDLRPA
ncbi:alpha/beta fold hydrolase [Phyllobacterium myrsinacearum]|uniref:Pimeloyl-ACP methyl ester carboxylesterase n=1 Tax=Phyllobacterium myrsinacearum TaxID=28101 RepID=A0A839EG81_9HYPH|nr:alpha/beta hydrolase [Phyllobacterium myrsinacearum]MBA8876604.1 pimeloyl-ACP methyl ester carboxylesterase [Phyllobacterium myrsinacearum]